MSSYWLCAGLIGILVGASELLSRYRDVSLAALQNRPAALYIVLNGVASLLAFALTRAFGWEFGVAANSDAKGWVQVLVSGFGAMVLFRSSLFTTQAGDREIGFGPARVLLVFLEAADQAVKRSLASQRAKTAGAVMRDVSFTQVYQTPAFCLTVMRDVPEGEQQALSKTIALLEKAPYNDRVKAHLLGVERIAVFGPDVLREALATLRSSGAAR